jgi:putative addiction module component (TIGR02574 family)
MTAAVERLRKEASQLPYDEREALVRMLDLDLDAAVPEDENPTDVEAAWDEEIKARVDDVKSGKAILLSQEEFDSAFDEARQRIAARAASA